MIFLTINILFDNFKENRAFDIDYVATSFSFILVIWSHISGLYCGKSKVEFLKIGEDKGAKGSFILCASVTWGLREVLHYPLNIVSLGSIMRLQTQPKIGPSLTFPVWWDVAVLHLQPLAKKTRDILVFCCFNAVPASQTMAQHCSSTGSTSRVCWGRRGYGPMMG